VRVSFLENFVDIENIQNKKQQTRTTKCVALVRKQTMPTERPPLVGEVSANFCE
jgi:hypothetical protein